MESEKMRPPVKTDTPELKGCPFCGGKAHHLHTKVRSSADPSILLDYDCCECKFCKASTRHFCDDKDAALAAWDRRADLCATAGDADMFAALKEVDKAFKDGKYDKFGRLRLTKAQGEAIWFSVSQAINRAALSGENK